MAEVEQALTSEADGFAAEKPKARPPRKLIEIIPSQLASLRAYHRAVLETEAVDAVHKMRVTTRRLQASLDLLEREMKVRKLKRRLRNWRRKLSSVRNYDVFLELIEKEATSRGKARREQLQLVKSILQERRERQATKVRQFLERIDIDKIAIRLGVSLASTSETFDSSSGDDELPSEPVAVDNTTGTMTIDEPGVAGYAAERLDQRLAEFQALVAQSHPTNDPAELHQLRIAAKRVRYLLEIVSAIGYGDASRALAWLRTLQDRIGDWHDLEALEEEIIAIVSSPEFMKQHLSESSQMLQAAAHLQKKKHALMARLFPVRVPKTLEISSRRIARALRRQSPRNLPREAATKA
ncbi:MAG: CHAD domain-containing protein [Acidobacteriota bacterium]